MCASSAAVARRFWKPTTAVGEVAVQVPPVLTQVVLLHELRVERHERIGQRGDRAALARYLGGDPLGDLAHGPVVDQDVGLRLAEHIDEPGGHDEA